MQAEQQSGHLRFKEWANDKGYDTAHTYDTERSRWVWLNPMTADLWNAWRAALSHPSTPQGWKQIGWTCGDGDCGRIHEAPGADGSYAVPVYVPAPPEQGGKG